MPSRLQQQGREARCAYPTSSIGTESHTRSAPYAAYPRGLRESSPTSRITTSARLNARRVTERSLRSSNTDRLPNLKTTTGHQRFFSRWLTSRRVSMQREISFYSDRYGKHVSGIWSVFGGRITVTAPDGRQQTTHVGSSTPETLARLMLIEIEGQRRRS